MIVGRQLGAAPGALRDFPLALGGLPLSGGDTIMLVSLVYVMTIRLQYVFRKGGDRRLIRVNDILNYQRLLFSRCHSLAATFL